MKSMNPIAIIIQPSALKPTPFAGLASGLCALSALVIALRVWTNYNHNKLYVDDHLSVISLLFLILNSVAFCLLVDVFNSNPNDVTIQQFTKLAAVGIASANCAIYSAKLPLLFLLMRTFGIKKWLRWACIFLMIFGTLGGLITLLYASIECSPDLHANTTPFLFSCVNAITDATIARGSISLAIDVVVFVLPIPVIVNLNMPLRRKIGLGFAFATGLLAITVSALCLYFQDAMSQGSSTNFTNAELVTIIEAAVVLMVSCTPAIHLCWTKYAGFGRKSLGLSSVSSENKSEPWGSKRGRSMTSDMNRIKIGANQYFELEESTESGMRPYEARAYGAEQDV